MGLMLHCGAELRDESFIQSLPAPDRKTDTHVPIEHSWFINRVKSELDTRGIKYKEGQYATTPDNERMFGLMELEEFSIPSIDARCQLFKDTELSVEHRHHLLVRLVEYGVLPARQMLSVEKEYERNPHSDDELLRDEHSYGHNVWRLLQSYTHELQRGGKFRTEHSRVDSISSRTQIANKMLQMFCDPDGDKMKRYMNEPELFGDSYAVSNSYRYVMGMRNSNDMKFPAGMVIGIAPFVCDNLAFSGEVEVKRKHTINIKRDLPILMTSKMDELLSNSIVAG
tara:strand:- start:1185 stop:2033 length:849 start_codon:yes stop_codon:yes gene_type:complete